MGLEIIKGLQPPPPLSPSTQTTWKKRPQQEDLMEATKHFASLCGITKEVKKSLLELKLKEMLLSTKIKFNNNQSC